jgi:hypothetical protein
LGLEIASMPAPEREAFIPDTASACCLPFSSETGAYGQHLNDEPWGNPRVQYLRAISEDNPFDVNLGGFAKVSCVVVFFVVFELLRGLRGLIVLGVFRGLLLGCGPRPHWEKLVWPTPRES